MKNRLSASYLDEALLVQISRRSNQLSQSRPGVKIKFWSPKFTNRPDVTPPALLRLVGGLSLFSVIGFLVFAVGQDYLSGGLSTDPTETAYVVILHFALPLLSFYLIWGNSPLSRWAVALYSSILCAATLTGAGVLGELANALPAAEAIMTALTVVVLLWLFVSPKMRYYYAVISGRPVPFDLEHRVQEFQSGGVLGPKSRAVVEWVLDHAETAVLLGFIVLVFYAYAST